MFVFTCDDKFEDVMCCIYTAWEKALKVGHDNVRLTKGAIEQYTFLDQYVHVCADHEIFEKVVRSIKQKISIKAYYQVYFASLSSRSDTPDIIYRFLVKGFKVGADIMNCLGDADVWDFLQLGSNVKKEAEHFKEFARFTSIDNMMYVCHLEPKSDVIEIVSWHFEDRMPSENWMIIDDLRSYAVIHPKDDNSYIRYFSSSEMERMLETEKYSDLYTQLWKTFFDAIAIKERTNRECQLNHMPLWKRKHMTEFM